MCPGTQDKFTASSTVCVTNNINLSFFFLLTDIFADLKGDFIKTH